MKKLFLVVYFAIFSISISAQVTWTHTEVKKYHTYTSLEERVEYYEVKFIANIQDGWHIYSTYQDSNSIGQGTYILIKDTLSQVSGVSEKAELLKRVDTLGFVNYEIYNTVIYTMWFFSKAKELTFYVTYQACTEHQCLPPDLITFSLKLP
jgi:hypothetical protein